VARANQQPDEVPRWREAKAAAARVDAGQLGEPVALARLEKIKAEAEAGFLDAERDAELRQALVEVRIARLDVGWDQTDEAYGRAFHDGGLDFDTMSVAELVARLKKRPPAVMVEVVAFLDHWQVVSRAAGKPQAEREKMQAVAIAADDDPFRNQLRSIIYVKGSTGRDAKLKALADDPRSDELNGPTALLLASSFSKNDDQIAQFRKAVVRHPEDVWLNFNLASRLNQRKPPPRDEVIRYYTAARACRPEVGLYLAQVLATMERFDEAEAIFRDLLTRRPDTMSNYFAFATFLKNRGRTEEAKEMESQAILAGRRAIARRPQDESAQSQLARNLFDRGKLDEAIAELRKLIRIKPGNSVLHNNLGVVLKSQGKIDEAIAEYREAIRLKPGFATAHNNLRDLLANQGKIDEAIAEYREAIRLKPDEPIPHYDLAGFLKARGKTDEAIAEYRETIRLDGKHIGSAPFDLGDMLDQMGRLDEALAVFRQILELAPADPAPNEPVPLKLAKIHTRIGRTLAAQGKTDEAIAESRETIRLNPGNDTAHNNLGVLLAKQGKLDEANAEYREAIRLNPGNNTAHNNLGLNLFNQGKLDEAIAEYREAIRLKPDYALAHSYLGAALRGSERFDEAIASYRRYRELSGTDPDKLADIDKAIADIERCKSVVGRIDAVVKGEVRPVGADELRAFRSILYFRAQHAAVVRLTDEAFRADPKLADDLESNNRYRAAYSAVLASIGKARDDPNPSDEARSRYRRQALDWLKADLALHSSAIGGGKPEAVKHARGILGYWKTDLALASVRGTVAIAKLPEAERAEWQTLWAEVDRLMASTPRP
jgi:tetratricopeptide (TPR) repeat protein